MIEGYTVDEVVRMDMDREEKRKRLTVKHGAREEFGVVVKPLIDWLRVNGNPLDIVVVTHCGADMFEGVKGHVEPWDGVGR